MASTNNTFEEIQKHKDEFHYLLRIAIKDGLSKISDAISSKKYIDSYYEWPSISFHKNGLPYLSSSNLQGAKDYRSLFRDKDGIKESEIKSFEDFMSFVTSNQAVENRFMMNGWMGAGDEEFPIFRSIFIMSFIKDVIERYIHIYNCFEYHENLADAIIEQAQNFIFSEVLPIDIVVPILFVDFPFDSYNLSSGIEIRRLTEKENLSRFTIKAYNISVHNLVLSSATHALVFKDWEVKNSPCMLEFKTLYDIRAYPINQINNFFAAIRLIKEINTGYAQVFSLSKSWFRHCKADLPHAIGTTTRSYPVIFEDYYWNIETVPQITDSEIKNISELFSLLYNSEENSINLSIKRLNQCLIRDSEEDSVLDATIALEALLSDDGNQEMTHKLAMRVGALVNLDSTFGKSPQQAFKDIKNIYAYRSAIVHGSKSLDKKRIVKIEDNKETTTHSLAVVYLRFVLRILLLNPQYRDPKLIDSELLLRSNILDDKNIIRGQSDTTKQ